MSQLAYWSTTIKKNNKNRQQIVYLRRICASGEMSCRHIDTDEQIIIITIIKSIIYTYIQLRILDQNTQLM